MRNTFVTVFLIIIAFSLGLSVDKSKIKFPTQDEVVPEVVEQETEEEVEAEYFEYKSPLGFSFTYDDGLKLENSFIVLPGGYEVAAVAAVRYVNEQHCGQSGLPEHCRPFLENPAVAFGVIEKTFEDLKKNELKDVMQFSEAITLGGKEGIQYYMGVEGEGVVTILVPFKADQTLLIQYTFDEFIDSMTTNNAGMYKSTEQKVVVDNLLSTLKF